MVFIFFLQAEVCFSTGYTAYSIYCAMVSVALCIIFLALQELVPSSELTVHAVSLPAGGVNCINREYSIALEALLLSLIHNSNELL